MKIKLFLTGLLLLVSTQTYAVEKDKLRHLVGSLLVFEVVYLVTGDKEKAAYSALAVGVAKELYDSRKCGTGFDTRDLVADAAGVGVGLAINFDF